MHVQQHQREARDHRQHRGRGEKFELLAQRGFPLLRRAANQPHSQRLGEGGAGDVIDHHIGHADLAEQLHAHGVADEHGVGEAAHDHEHPGAALGNAQQLCKQPGQQEIGGVADKGHRQHPQGIPQHLPGEVVLQTVDAHAGHGEAQQKAADEALALRRHPALFAAHPARCRQQQDDRHRGDGVEKRRHGFTCPAAAPWRQRPCPS